MGYYNVTNDVPICLDFKRQEFKNKDVGLLIDYMKDLSNNFPKVLLLKKSWILFNLVYTLLKK